MFYECVDGHISFFIFEKWMKNEINPLNYNEK
jgi:hypothetical protein